MRSFGNWAKLAVVAMAGFGVETDEASARVEAGMLTCEVGKGFALIISKPRDLHCVFHKTNGQTEAYAGKLREVGLDIGVSGRGVIAWGVIAATSQLPPGELAGTYAGAEAGAAAVVGGRGRILVGGARRTISLQPLSVQGEVGINIAVGVASMSLHPLLTGRPRAGTHAPAVGQSHAAVPHDQQIPHYGCGSYTHLQQGQTIYGLAHACGVTVEALLDANPQITNVRNIDAGALIHLPTHVGHHTASPCGDHAILGENESLDHLAWRCGITLHALLLENPDIRDMALVQPGLVLAIPEKGAPSTQPPVEYAMSEADLMPPEGRVVSDAPATSPLPLGVPAAGALLSARDRARLEIICVNEATNRFRLSPGDVVAMNSVPASGQTISVTLDANGRDGACLIDRNGTVLYVTDLSSTHKQVAASSGAEAQAAAGVESHVVRFAAGASSATLRGSVTGYDSTNYLLGARAGQTMSVRFSPDNASCYFNVLPPTGDTAIFNGSTSGNDFAGGLPADGQYTIQTYLMRNAARRNETCNFAIAFAVTGGAARSGAPDSSSDVSPAAQQACLAAVRRETNETNVTMLGSEFSEANSEVMVGVGAQRAPWRCLVSNDGVVQEVMFTGDDSAGVDRSAAMPPFARPASSDVTDAAQDSCVAAVRQETGEGDVAVLSSEFSEANSEVMVGVGAQRAPWRCLVSSDGVVQEVMFTGDDSAGVDPSAMPPADPAAASDVTDAAKDSCLAAVRQETGEGDVVVLSSQFSEANSEVMVGVGAQRAPWRCLVSNDGAVQEVEFTGSEGAL